MCVYSMVVDHFQRQFDPWLPRPQQPTFVPDPPSPADAARLKKLIEDFQKAIDAAKQVDSLTAQPDCEDPEKAKLVERVAVLEKELAALKGKRTRKRKSP